ncbi:creatininase family protein [Allosphingosinicella deserti]|nr:creatininase family protein [Sphingomonas deserti]
MVAQAWLLALFAGVFLAPSAAAGAPSPPPDAPSILAGTAADLTWLEFEAAAKSGAVILWAIGSIEEHGPHLPLATDTYVPANELARVQRTLSAEGVSSIILPPYYWGVNHVTGAFPGSIHIRPETMSALLQDVFQSVGRSGFRDLFLITGHYDAAHNRAISDAVRKARLTQGPNVTFVVPAALGTRIGLTRGEPGFAFADLPAADPNAPPDLHAGKTETSMMLAGAPATVRTGKIARLPPTRLDAAELAVWRRGQEHARALTPGGYLGAPAQASAALGETVLADEAAAYARAISAALGTRQEKARDTSSRTQPNHGRTASRSEASGGFAAVAEARTPTLQD